VPGRARELGRGRPLAGLTDDELAATGSRRRGGLAPRTWNRHLATVGSLLSWCRRHGWPAGPGRDTPGPGRRGRRLTHAL